MKLLLWAWMRICLLLAILGLAFFPDSANARLLSQGDNPNRDPDILYDQGLDLFVQGQYEIALPILEDALQLYKTADNQPGEAVCLTLIGVASYRLSNFIDAVDALESALSIWQEIDNLNGEGTALMGLGAIYESLHQNEQALRYYKEALLA